MMKTKQKTPKRKRDFSLKYVLSKIIGTWVAGPILGGIFAILLYLLLKFILTKRKIHLLKLDAYLKYGLLIVGAFGAYSLGANNVSNVVGVFIPSLPDINLNFGFFNLSLLLVCVQK